MANFSQINAVSGGQVKTATDLWMVRSGALVPAQSAWAVKNNALVKVWERAGGPVSMVLLEPSQGATVQHGFTLKFRVQVPKIDGARLGASIRFQGAFDETVAVDEATGICEKFVHFTQENKSVTLSLISDNGYIANQIVYTASVFGGSCTVKMTSPTYDQQFFGAQNITWTAKAEAIPGHTGVPQGTMRFDGPRGEVQNVAVDTNGYASATFWHGSGERWCTAEFRDSTNGFSPVPEGSDRFGRIRMMINTRYQSTGYFDRTSHRNYEGANGGPQNTTPIVCGDLSGKSWRAISMCSRPAKPVSDAYCVAAWAVYTPGTQSAGIRIGYHTKDAYPATGTFTGLQQNLVTGPGTQSVEQWVDIGLHVASAINNETFRGMVYGGPADSTPYSWVAVAGVFCGLVVTWEWWRWIDT